MKPCYFLLDRLLFFVVFLGGWHKISQTVFSVVKKMLLYLVFNCQNRTIVVANNKIDLDRRVSVG